MSSILVTRGVDSKRVPSLRIYACSDTSSNILDASAHFKFNIL